MSVVAGSGFTASSKCGRNFPFRTVTTCGTVIASSPSAPCVTPHPLAPRPPNGVAGCAVGASTSLIVTLPAGMRAASSSRRRGVRREDRRAEPERRLLRQRHRVVNRVERDDRRDRREARLAADAASAGALRRKVGRAVATRPLPSADVAASGVAPRPTASAISRSACVALRRAVTSAIGCRVRAASFRNSSANAAYLLALHEDPPHRDARLPAVERHPEPRGLRRHLHVRVGQHEHRVAAGQFQRRGDEPLAEPRRELPPDRVRPGEDDVIDVRLGQLRAGLAGRGERSERGPRGKPASRNSACVRSAVRGAFSLGFHSTALPATSACAICTDVQVDRVVPRADDADHAPRPAVDRVAAAEQPRRPQPPRDRPRGEQLRAASCSRNLSAAAVGSSSVPSTSTAGRPMSACTAAKRSSARSTSRCAEVADAAEALADGEPRPGLLRGAGRGEFGCEGRHADRVGSGQRE